MHAQGHSAQCREFGILQKNFKNKTGFHQMRFHCLASLSGKIGNYWEGLATREKSGIIRIFPDNSQLGNYRESVLAISFGDNQPCVCTPAEHCYSVTPASPIGDCGTASSTKHLCHH
jgi:hypothetical protein